MSSFFQKAFDKGPLLPASLANRNGVLTNAFLRIAVRDQAGVLRYEAGPLFPDGISVRLPFGDTYERVLAGFVAELTRHAGRSLLISGAPRSRRS